MNRKTIRETAAAGLALRLPFVPGQYYAITGWAAEVGTIPGLAQDLAEAHAAEDLYFNSPGVAGNDIRVYSWDYVQGGSDHDVHLGVAPVGSPTYCDFYAGISAKEINAAIDEILQTLSWIDDTTVPLITDGNVIDLTATLPWLKRKRQLLELKYRKTVTLSPLKITEWPVVEVNIDEVVESGARKVKASLWDVPSDVTDTVLCVRARHYYDALDTVVSRAGTGVTTTSTKLNVSPTPGWVTGAYVGGLVTCNNRIMPITSNDDDDLNGPAWVPAGAPGDGLPFTISGIDTIETHCPDALIIAATKVSILKRLPSRFKEAYADRAAIFDRDLREMRILYNSMDTDRPMTNRFFWDGPEVPVESWEW